MSYDIKLQSQELVCAASGHPIRAGLPDDPNLKSGITLRGTVEDGVGVVTDGELLIHYDRHWEGTNLFFY